MSALLAQDKANPPAFTEANTAPAIVLCGAPSTGMSIAANTGAFWHATTGIPVLGADAVEHLLALARA